MTRLTMRAPTAVVHCRLVGERGGAQGDHSETARAALLAWERRRSRPKKRRRNAPSTGWLIAELAQLAGVSVRTVRHYLTRQVLVSPEFFGVQTRYDRVHLLRLLAIPVLKARGLRRLTDVRRKLDELGQAGLVQLLQTQPLPAATRTALGLPPDARSPEAPLHSQAAARTAAPAVATFQSQAAADATNSATTETWHRLQLMPGLELNLRSDASPFVREAAQQIRERYSAR